MEDYEILENYNDFLDEVNPEIVINGMSAAARTKYGGDLPFMSEFTKAPNFVRFITRHAVLLFEILRFGFVIPENFW